MQNNHLGFSVSTSFTDTVLVVIFYGYQQRPKAQNTIYKTATA